MNTALTEVLSPAPPYDCGGAGVWNAAILTAAQVRPAFFDVSCLVYRLIYAKADDYCRKCSNDPDRMANWIAADVLSDIAAACTNFACAPVLAFDSVHSKRKLEYDEYKGGARGTQKKTPNEELALECRNEARRLLDTVYATTYGIQTYCEYGYESDDIIAALVLGLKQHGLMERPAYDKPVVIVTSDHDLYQLLIEGVFLADVTTGQLCTGDDVAKHTGIAVRDVVAAKCVGGCKSDNVGNVAGCGEVTVQQVLSDRTTERLSVKRAKASLESEEGAAVLRRNLRLIRLPYEGLQAVRLSPSPWPKPGVPEKIVPLLESNGIPRQDWPSFGDITLPRSPTAIPVCAYKKKEMT